LFAKEAIEKCRNHGTIDEDAKVHVHDVAPESRFRLGLHFPVVRAALPVVTGVQVNAQTAQNHRRASMGSTNRVSPHFGQHASPFFAEGTVRGENPPVMGVLRRDFPPPAKRLMTDDTT